MQELNKQNLYQPVTNTWRLLEIFLFWQNTEFLVFYFELADYFGHFLEFKANAPGPLRPRVISSSVVRQRRHELKCCDAPAPLTIISVLPHQEWTCVGSMCLDFVKKTSSQQAQSFISWFLPLNVADSGDGSVFAAIGATKGLHIPLQPSSMDWTPPSPSSLHQPHC